MLGRLGLAGVAAVALAACEPKADTPALDGAAELDGAPAATDAAAGELAGGGSSAPAAALPGVIGIVLPEGITAIDNCETIIAADYTNPPKMTCLLLQTQETGADKLDARVSEAIAAAGWQFIRAQGAQHYFERPHAGTDCAETAVISVEDERVQAVIDHAGGGAPSAGSVWQAYAIPNSTREACGADRMKP